MGDVQRYVELIGRSSIWRLMDGEAIEILQKKQIELQKHGGHLIKLQVWVETMYRRTDVQPEASLNNSNIICIAHVN